MKMRQKYWLVSLLFFCLNASAQTPAENTPGNNAWNVYVYNSSGSGLTFDQYVGYFPLNLLSFDVSSHVLQGDPSNGPSVATGYTRTSATASVSTYNFSIKFIRTGWTCGSYRFTLTQWDDFAGIYVDTDGDNVWDIVTPTLTCCSGTATYDFFLNPNSIVMVGFKEATGAADLNVNIAYSSAASYCFSASVASTQNVSCAGGSDGAVTLALNEGTPPFTVNGSSYATRSITVSGLSANAYNWTVTDATAESRAVSFTIGTTADVTPPNAVARNITAYLDFNGRALLSANDLDNGTTDNCALASLAINQTTFTCADLGNRSIILTATDASGNTDQATATVSVVDTIRPTVVTQNITLTLDANGQATTTAAAIDNGTSDNCSLASLSLSQTAFTCADLGNRTVTLTATDGSGNVGTGQAIVRVIDNTPPTLVVQPVTAYLNLSGQVSVPASAYDNGSFDNCTLSSLTASRTAFTCTDTGGVTVTLTALDQSGNSATANVVLTIRDTLAPTVLAADTTLYLDAVGQASLSAMALDRGTTDNCGVASRSISQTAYDCSHLGANAITFTATDASGNVATLTRTVTVLDTIAPVAVAQPDTLYLDALGAATLDLNRVDAASTDNCSLPIRALSRTAYACADVGADMVVLTVTDPAGLTATDTVEIIIRDTLRPIVVAQDITVYLDSMGLVAWDTAMIDAGTTDNCGLDTVYLSRYAASCAQLGVDSVQLYAVDVNGNQDSAKAYITILDTIAPVLAYQPVTVYLDAAGTAPLTVAMVDTGTLDNCSLDTLYLSRQLLTCADVGTLLVALTAIDGSGNVSTDSLLVTVRDTLAPIVVARTLTKNLDPNGMVSLTVAEVELSSTDNCGIATKWLSHNTLECSEVGLFPIVLYVEDVNGNVGTDTVLISVEDVNDPLIVTQNVTLELDSAGRATLNPNLLNNGSTDNCAVASFVASRTAFSCVDLGQNPVVATAIDESGNTASASVFVTVVDRIAPVVRTRDVTVVLDTNGVASITAAMIDAGSTDNCGVASLSINQTAFDCSHVGAPVAVALTVTDGSGNAAFGIANVTVIDAEAPTFVCRPYEWSMDATGVLTLTPDDMIDSIVELCDYSVTLSQTAFDVSHIGENPVQIVMTDAGGNVTTCETVVRVRFDCIPYNGVITPNNDGYNDSWEVECLAAVDNEVAVYNRFGQVVFFAENYTGGWTGIGTDGNPLPRGTYFYLIKIRVGGTERSVRGNITLLRR